MQGSGRSKLCGGERAVYWQLPLSGTRAVRFGAHDLTRLLCHELQVSIMASIQLRVAVTVWALPDGLVICKRSSVACCAGFWPLLRFPEVRIGARGEVVSDARKRLRARAGMQPLYESIVTLPFRSFIH